MAEISQAAALGGAVPTIDTARPAQSVPLILALKEMADREGVGVMELVKEFARLAFGPGKLTFDEYRTLALFDRKRYAGADKKAFIGFAAARHVWLEANYRHDWFALVADKVAASGYLAAYGFPVIPIEAILSAELGIPGERLLRSDAELRRFLVEPARYPLFGKPVAGLQSLGSASLDRYEAASETLVGTDGRRIPLAAFVAEIMANYPGGYIFQRRVAPHPAVRAICGDRLATVRLVTVLRDSGPTLLRACWKIPAGANTADNFWRPGNLLAQLDPTTGRVLRVVRGTGMSLEELSHHPDSGAPLVGTEVPHWAELTRLALEGARLVKEVALIGWDIAPVEAGGVVVEFNETPDFILPQLADGRGILDEEFRAFLAERRRHAAAWRRAQKAGARG
jgi:hypothetical protein